MAGPKVREVTVGALRVRSYGVVVELAWQGLPPASSSEVALLLPPGAVPTTAAPEVRVVLYGGPPWRLEGPEGAVLFDSWDDLRHGAERALAGHIALQSPDRIFFHAGVVGTEAGAIVLPGRSFAGKSTLVVALCRLGCRYLSDEYAVVSPEGLLIPYPRRLSLRVGERRLTVAADELGAATETDPLPPAAVVVSVFQPGVATDLRPVPAREGVMALIDNAIAARTRPRDVLRAAGALVRDSLVLQGVRDDADEAAAFIVASFSNRGSTPRGPS